jgi:hypothetical protein
MINNLVRGLLCAALGTATSGAQAAVNAASGASAVAPGSIISIYGIAAGVIGVTGQATTLPLPTSAENGRVYLSLLPISLSSLANRLSLFYWSPSQVNALLPSTVSTGAVTIAVREGGWSRRRRSPGWFRCGERSGTSTWNIRQPIGGLQRFDSGLRATADSRNIDKWKRCADLELESGPLRRGDRYLAHGSRRFRNRTSSEHSTVNRIAGQRAGILLGAYQPCWIGSGKLLRPEWFAPGLALRCWKSPRIADVAQVRIPGHVNKDSGGM